MSWGLSLTSLDSSLLIDQSFPGHYLGAENPRYLTDVSFTNPFPPSGSGAPRGLAHGTFLQLPAPSLGIHLTDGLFCRPPGPLTHMGSSLGWATIDHMLTASNTLSLVLRTPCYVLHYKSLATHPVAATGYGMAVYTPSGQQAFNSAAHKKRLDVVSSGVVGSSTTVETYVGVYGQRVVLLQPVDSISNYYGFISTATTKYISIGWGPGLPSGGAAPIGNAYEYNFTNNTISIVGTFLDGAYYCVAKVSG